MGILDSRDLQKQLEELENLKDAVDNLRHELEGENDEEEIERIQDELDDAEADFGDDEQEELDQLETMAEHSEWKYGVAFIPEEDFTEYCEELCKDIGDIPQELPWYISNHIDWQGVADEISADYSEYEYQGTTYLARD